MFEMQPTDNIGVGWMIHMLVNTRHDGLAGKQR
jgi:hypothetical protein